MDIKIVYFSPTGGTKKYCTDLAKRLGNITAEFDLTKPENRKQPISFMDSDFVIIGAPVYGGRLPALEQGLFDNIVASGTPAVLLVTYGNREYEDALLELKTVCEKKGFKTIAAGAFIAPHMLCAGVATDRPNEEDFAALDSFAKGIIGNMGQKKEIKVKGNIPFKVYEKFPFSPCADDKCNNCDICVSVCPTGAIVAEDPKSTDKTKCILCFACVRDCPQKARGVKSRLFKVALYLLTKKLARNHKKPEVFL